MFKKLTSENEKPAEPKEDKKKQQNTENTGWTPKIPSKK
jgi:hypothetical protein